MKVYITLIAASLTVATLVAGTVPTQSAYATAQADSCTVTAVGTKNSAGQNGSKFTIKGNKVTGTFKVSGKDCHEPVTLAVWKSTKTNRPLTKQRLYKSATATFSSGTHTLTAELPDCYYQVDLVRGDKADLNPAKPGAERYGKDRILGWVVDGNKACTKKTTADTQTPETPAAETPSTPAVEAATDQAPETLPSTGPAAALTGIAGISTIGASLQYYMQSRRRLLNR